MKTIKELETEIEFLKTGYKQLGVSERRYKIQALKDVLKLIDEINEVNFKGNIEGKVLLTSKKELKAKIEGK